MTYEIGAGEEAVTIELNGEVVAICTEYDIRQSILTVPSSFNVTVEGGDLATELLKRFPPRTPFRLLIGDRVQFAGWTDGNETGSPSGGTEVSIHGRDHLAPLVDAFVETEKSFTEQAMVDIVDAAIVAGYPEGERPALIFDNELNRQKLSGGKPKRTKKLKVGEALLRAKLGQQFDTILGFAAFKDSIGSDTAKAFGLPPKKLEEAIEEAVQTAPAQQQKTVQAKVGKQWYSGVIKPELDRMGACLWADCTGDSLIISAPNPNQTPLYKIERFAGQVTGQVKDHRFRSTAAGRYARVDVHIRTGGGKGGRGRGLGSWVDDEMVAWGYTRVLSIADSKATSQQQATEFARRKVAECRRSGWSLQYKLAGLTTPSLQGNTRVIWAPDTVVLVEDEELGLSGPFWIEAVEQSRRPETTTTVSLMRPEDVIFGTMEAA